MVPIQGIAIQPANSQLSEQSHKNSNETNRQLKNRNNKKASSFQTLLTKPKAQGKTISKQENRGSEHQQQSEQGKRYSKSGRNGDIGILPAAQPVPLIFHLPPTIEGTENRDVLFGTQGNDIIDGKEGNDVLLGRRGDDRLIGGEGSDLLLGGRGNDQLEGGNARDWLIGGSGSDSLDGGKGNDWLFSGRGNDSLNGGQGSDRMYGGSGNDTFADESGNNSIDGGQGFDTFNLGKGIDSYHISVNKQGEFTIQELSRRLDSPVHTVKNIESFKFADVTLSAQELGDRVNNPVQDLSLSKPQKAAVESVFNIDAASVQDNDHNGKISAGDTVSGTVFSESNPFNPVSFKVSQDNADHINGDLGADLSLSSERLQKIDSVTNSDPLKQMQAIGVLDADKSGDLSEGDVVYSRSNRITTGGDPIAGGPSYHRLTADDIKQINNDPSVPLSDEQSKTLNEVFSIRGEFGASVLDKDGNQQLSEGDTVVITGGVTGGEITRFDLTKDQASHINGEFGNRIDLSNEQITSLLGGPVPSDFGYYALDTDNSGVLSAGDKLVTFGTFTINGLVNPNYKTVTTADIQTISGSEPGIIPEISNAGINLFEGKDVPTKNVGEVKVGKQQLPPYLDKPFEQHIISSQSQLNQLRADLGLPLPGPFGGGLPGTTLPSVDFNEQVLVYTVRDAADPNNIQSNFKLNDDGTLTSQVLSTKIGFQPSDEAVIEFSALSREGIEQFANSDPITSKTPETSGIRDILNENKEKWSDAGLASYRYTLERSCFCTEEARRPVDNTFDNGKLTSVFHDGRAGEVPEHNKLNVKDLFKIIDEAISRDAAEIRVEYDSELGHPTSIYIDYDQRIADEELSLTISNLNEGTLFQSIE